MKTGFEKNFTSELSAFFNAVSIGLGGLGSFRITRRATKRGQNKFPRNFSRRDRTSFVLAERYKLYTARGPGK